MKILITNDDGINATGIRVLARWAKKHGEITVVAPKTEQSAKSHAIELVKPIEIKEVPFMEGVRAYSVDSTPADCVRFAVLGLKEKFDLVLSGVNYGVNLGADVVYSGTIGAVFEGIRMGIKAIAFSTFPDNEKGAEKYLDEVYSYIIDNDLLSQNPIYNVNIPYQSKGIKMTYQGSQYYSDFFVKIEGEENLYRQDGELIADVCPNDLNRDGVAVKAGYISITPLLATRTNMAVFEKYRTK